VWHRVVCACDRMMMAGPYLCMEGGHLGEEHAGEVGEAGRVSSIVCGSWMDIARRGCLQARRLCA
jgi:hypothetical protein